ncbi:PEP/pyruvate-binding domain-containing protein, partial [Candidatus Marithioploca araucensis]|nr:PEP/pyruvate-binding domain-containing protein [Candidatus Marithioploca araucensis]
MTKQYILSSKEASLYNQAMLGGKAYNLAWLSRYQFQVPDWFVLTTEAFDLQVQSDKTEPWIQAQLAGLNQDNQQRKARSIRKRITQNELHADLIKALEEKLATIEDWQTEYFAVRSSVVGEDAEGASFAGQMDSFLFQKGLSAIADSVLKVFASAFNERALAYRLNKGMTLTNSRVAVIIQKMVAGQVSGVMFTAHPVTGSYKHVLISACYGAGEGIVSGVCNTDEYTISLENQTVKKQIGEKDIQLVLDTQAGKGVIQTNVKEQLRNQSCLKEEEIKALVQLGEQIAAEKCAPQDIEWTLKNGNFYILQTRPITSLPAPAKPIGETVVWDNSNIQESYSGVTTPLTFSFASRGYALVYAQTMRILGLSDKVIKEYQQTLDNLLGLIKGRVYYNINNWYRGLSLLPSFKTNKADMEKMMGLQDSVDFVQDRKLTFWEKVKKLPNNLKAVFNLLTRFRKIDHLVAEFQAMFQREYKRIDRQK